MLIISGIASQQSDHDRRRLPGTAILLVAMLLVAPAASASDFEAGMRYVLTTVSANDFDGGTLDIPAGGGFAGTAELFVSSRASAHFAATFVNPEAILHPTTPPPDEVDLGTLGMDAYSLTGRWYFRPDARLQPFAGAGLAWVAIGNLEDRFGDAIELTFDPQWAPVAETGLRYQLFDRIAIDVSVSWMPLSADSKIVRNDEPSVPLPSTIELDPLTVSAGAAWRF